MGLTDPGPYTYHLGVPHSAGAVWANCSWRHTARTPRPEPPFRKRNKLQIRLHQLDPMLSLANPGRLLGANDGAEHSHRSQLQVLLWRRQQTANLLPETMSNHIDLAARQLHVLRSLKSDSNVQITVNHGKPHSNVVGFRIVISYNLQVLQVIHTCCIFPPNHVLLHTWIKCMNQPHLPAALPIETKTGNPGVSLLLVNYAANYVPIPSQSQLYIVIFLWYIYIYTHTYTDTDTPIIPRYIPVIPQFMLYVLICALYIYNHFCIRIYIYHYIYQLHRNALTNGSSKSSVATPWPGSRASPRRRRQSRRPAAAQNTPGPLKLVNAWRINIWRFIFIIMGDSGEYKESKFDQKWMGCVVTNYWPVSPPASINMDKPSTSQTYPWAYHIRIHCRYIV